jgi:glutathione S-transferase
MIKLYQFPTGYGLPNFSPFCVKVELFLRMADLDYEVIEISDPRKGPKGKAPFVEADGERIGDSHLIVNALQQRHGLDLDGHLSDAQRALTLAIERMLDEHFYWGLVYSRWLEEQNFKTLKNVMFGQLPALLRGLFPALARRAVRGQLHAHGIGRHTRDELYAMCCADLRAVAALLGDRPYLHGDRISLADIYIVSYTANVLKPPFPSPLTDEAKRHPNLIAHSDRVLKELYE